MVGERSTRPQSQHFCSSPFSQVTRAKDDQAREQQQFKYARARTCVEITDASNPNATPTLVGLGEREAERAVDCHHATLDQVHSMKLSLVKISPNYNLRWPGVHPSVRRPGLVSQKPCFCPAATRAGRQPSASLPLHRRTIPAFQGL